MNADPNELLKSIRALLVEELGEFRPGVPAIAVEPPQIPNTGNGLQVTISRQPKKLSQSMWRWVVTIVQRDRTEMGFRKFDGACRKMRLKFPLATETILPFEEGAFTQATFQIDAPQYYFGSAIVENEYD